MRRRWVILGGAGLLYLVAVNAANDPPAYAYRGWKNQLWIALGLQGFWHPCYRRVEDEQRVVFHGLPTDRCYRMTPPRRMRGVWIDEFEGSQFVPGARDASQARPGLGGIWLDVETNEIPGLFRSSEGGLRAYRIDFIGRQTAVAGRYGHLSASDHTIIVDRLISARSMDVTPYARKLDAWREGRETERAKGSDTGRN